MKCLCDKIDETIDTFFNERMDIQSFDVGFVYTMEGATLTITNAIEYTVHDKEQLVLHIRDLFVKEEYRGRGIGSALLYYGLMHSMEQSPEIRYSDLEDNSDFPVDAPCNIYYKFGYRFKQGDPQEKWLDLVEFKTRHQYNCLKHTKT